MAKMGNTSLATAIRPSTKEVKVISVGELTLACTATCITSLASTKLYTAIPYI